MSALFPARASPEKKSIARSIVSADTSAMFFPATVTARLSGLSREPPQDAHACDVMNVSIQRRIASDFVW